MVRAEPNRSNTVNKAKNDTSLAPSLRVQVTQAIELTMDFRNNRNSAHLGNIDANTMDAACVIQNVTWIVGEIVRLETQKRAAEVKSVLDQLAKRHVPIVQTVNGQLIVLRPSLEADDKAIILLYQQRKPISINTLREWVGYKNASRWRDKVIGDLVKQAFVHVGKDENVVVLRPGEAAAQSLLLSEGAL